MKISKETILKLLEYSDLNKMESAKDMQQNLEFISEILEEEFPEISSDYILENL